MIILILAKRQRRKTMADLNKKDIKKRVSEMLDKLNDIKTELEELASDVENESENIEPYEGRNELTIQQQERQEWLDECQEALESAVSDIENIDLSEYSND